MGEAQVGRHADVVLGLQPYVPRAATLCTSGSNPMYLGLQPYVSQVGRHDDVVLVLAPQSMVGSSIYELLR